MSVIILVIILLPIVFSTLALMVCFIIPYWIRNYRRNQFLKTRSGSGCVYITFDDGPEHDATEKILQILEKNTVKATFFVTTVNAQKHPVLLKKIITQGHCLGYHGNKHLHPYKANPLAYYRDLLNGFEDLQALIPRYPITLFRPPYGKLNVFTLLFLMKNKQLKTVYWNLDPEDYRSANKKAIVEYVKLNLKPGSVILLHDSRQPGNTPVANTVEALPELIALCKKENLWIQVMH